MNPNRTTDQRERTALLVVDVQNDFCEGGSLAVSGGAEVAAQVRALIDTSAHDVAVATRDYHVDPGEHFAGPEGPDFRTSWPRHCEVGTAGADFHPALGGDFLEKVDAVISKGEYEAAYSGFEGHRDEAGDDQRQLVDYLRAEGVEHVDVVGIATDHCVLATARDAVSAGFGVTVIAALTAGVDQDASRAALAELEQLGATIA